MKIKIEESYKEDNEPVYPVLKTLTYGMGENALVWILVFPMLLGHFTVISSLKISCRLMVNLYWRINRGG